MGRYLIAAVDDMFFASKIRATAEGLGLEVRFTKNADAAIEMARAEMPSLLVADLHSEKSDPFGLAERMKAEDGLRDIELVGFFSHVETALQERATRAGYDRVMPRSAFSNQLPQILSEALSDEA